MDSQADPKHPEYPHIPSDAGQHRWLLARLAAAAGYRPQPELVMAAERKLSSEPAVVAPSGPQVVLFTAETIRQIEERLRVRLNGRVKQLFASIAADPLLAKRSLAVVPDDLEQRLIRLRARFPNCKRSAAPRCHQGFCLIGSNSSIRL